MASTMQIGGVLSPLWLGATLGGFAVAAAAVVQRTIGDRGLALRLSATYLLALWALVAAFFVLSPFRQFGVVPAAVIGIAAGAVALAPRTRRLELRACARDDWRAAVSTWRDLTLPSRGLLVLTLALGAAMVLRTLVSPALGWDDLTYHLFKSGSWVGAGGFTSDAAPDAWSYYDHFPASGEVVWAWFLLPARSGTFLGLASATAWIGAMAGGYSAARGLGAGRNQATTAALAIGTVGAAALFVETSYVDNLALGAFLVGVALLIECHRRFRWWPVAGTAGAFALAAGVKVSGLTPLALASVWLAVLAWRARPERRAVTLLTLAGIVAGASVVAAPWYLRALVQEGSPLYPVAAPVLGDRLPANRQLESLFGGTLTTRGTAVRTGYLSGVVELARTLSTTRRAWMPAPFLWAGAAAVGAGGAFARRRGRGPVLFLVLCSAAGVAVVLLPSSAGLRVLFPDEVARLLLTTFASMVLLAMVVPWRRLLLLPQLLVAAQLAFTTHAFVRSWGAVDLRSLRLWAQAGAVIVAATVVGIVIALVVPRVERRTRAWAIALVASAGVLLLLGAPLARVRDEQRYPVYAAASRSGGGRTLRVQAADESTCANPMWEAVDLAEGHTVAVTAGFAGVGHNAHRYPFLGSRLQNTVTYVPITADGSLVDYLDPSAGTHLDEHAWLDRLERGRVDYVAVLMTEGRPPPEADVIARHPERFERVATSTCEPSALYRVRAPGTGA